MNKWKKGSYTVEAVFLIPMILLLLILLMTYDFYIHNKNWYLSAAYEAALAGNGRIKEVNSNAEKEAEEKAKERINQQVMPGNKPAVEIKNYSWGIHVQYSGQMFPVVSTQWFTYTIDAKVRKVSPVKYLQTLWIMDKSKNGIGENIEGGS